MSFLRCCPLTVDFINLMHIVIEMLALIVDFMNIMHVIIEMLALTVDVINLPAYVIIEILGGY